MKHAAFGFIGCGVAIMLLLLNMAYAQENLEAAPERSLLDVIADTLSHTSDDTETQPVIVPEDPVLTDPANYRPRALLRSLNKITATLTSLEVEQSQPSQFGNLIISLKKCWQAPPEMEPESKALLEIWEEVPGEQKTRLFYGWMLASSPSLSSLEHPVYDITLLSCQGVAVSPLSNNN